MLFILISFLIPTCLTLDNNYTLMILESCKPFKEFERQFNCGQDGYFEGNLVT